MWRAVRQRTKPARDWYRCHCKRSEPCLKKTGPSILLPFKQTKGHLCTEPLLCCYRRRLLPASVNSSHQHKPTASDLCICHVFSHCHLTLCRNETLFWFTLREKLSTLSVNAFPLSPFASRLFLNRALLRVAGALLNSIPLLLRHKFKGSH